MTNTVGKHLSFVLVEARAIAIDDITLTSSGRDDSQNTVNVRLLLNAATAAVNVHLDEYKESTSRFSKYDTSYYWGIPNDAAKSMQRLEALWLCAQLSRRSDKSKVLMGITAYLDAIARRLPTVFYPDATMGDRYLPPHDWLHLTYKLDNSIPKYDLDNYWIDTVRSDWYRPVYTLPLCRRNAIDAVTIATKLYHSPLLSAQTNLYHRA